MSFRAIREELSYRQAKEKNCQIPDGIGIYTDRVWVFMEPLFPKDRKIQTGSVWINIRRETMSGYWLMKSEPLTYSIDRLKKEKKTLWDGVRNYQARNFMTNDMRVGDRVLFYHSNANPPGVAGVAKIIGEAVPDPTQFNGKSEYFDPKAHPEKPRWFCVKVGFEKKFKNFVSLHDLRLRKDLEDLPVLKKGQRLSIQPLTKKQFDGVCRLGDRD